MTALLQIRELRQIEPDSSYCGLLSEDLLDDRQHVFLSTYVTKTTLKYVK